MARRFGLAAALAGLLAVTADDGASGQGLPDGERFVFGDSLSDTGSSFAATGGRSNPFSPTVVPNGFVYNTAFPDSLQNPQAGAPTERFSNGDIHVDRLAGDLTPVVGPFNPTQNAQPIPNTTVDIPVEVNPNRTFAQGETGPDGFNFAHGGAETDLTNSGGANIGFASQVAAFATLQQAGRLSVDPDDTAVVWIGGNDFFNAAQTGALGRPTVQTAVQNVGAGLNTLASRGVRNIVVYNMPDLSEVPLAGELADQAPNQQRGQQLLTALRDAARGFNQQLQTQVIGQLRDRGVNVTVVDLQRLFADIAARPGAYGVRDGTTHCFSLVSGQPTGDCQSAQAVDSATFIDSLHLTETGHEIVAEFARGSMFTQATASAVYATAPRAALLVADGHNAVIDSRLRQIRAGLRGASFAGGQGPTVGESADGETADGLATKLSLFVYANHNRGDRDSGIGVAGFDYNQTVVTAGLDYEINDALLVGVAGGYSAADTHLAGALGNGQIDSKLVSVYGTLTKGGVYGDLTGTISLDEHTYDRRTEGPLGRADAEAHGQTFSFALNGGYNLRRGPVRFGPTVGVRLLDTEIEDFNEDGAGPLNLEIGDLNAQTAIGSVGAQAAGRFTFGGGNVIAPQLGLSFEHDFTNETIEVATTLPAGGQQSTRAKLGRDNAVILDGGVTVGTTYGLSASLGGRTSFGREGSDYGARARLRFTF
jgi:phospholipase/lecithinase/hemolysin/uncharacterized protein YhjY with autotransporter beta-barrel domain